MYSKCKIENAALEEMQEIIDQCITYDKEYSKIEQCNDKTDKDNDNKQIEKACNYVIDNERNSDNNRLCAEKEDLEIHWILKEKKIG